MAVKESKVESLVISSPIITLTFDDKSLDTISKLDSKEIKIKAAQIDVSSGSNEQLEEIGNRPVFDIEVSSGSTNITNFNGGKVTVSIPYTLAPGENPHTLIVYYIRDDGKFQKVPNCSYADGKVTFVTTHFSKYAIANTKANFLDIAGNDYIDSIKFVVARGLFSVDETGRFNPTDTMTRAMLFTVLANWEGIDKANYAERTVYKGVAVTEWFAPYVAWATEAGITSGVGEGYFAPNQPVNREQMAVIMYNFAKLKDYKLPDKYAGMAFTDEGQFSSWSKAAITATQKAGIMTGRVDSIFDPKGLSNRTEAAITLKNLIDVFVSR